MVGLLNQRIIPNTELLRALSHHFEMSAPQYEEHRQGLKANQEPLTKDWAGDAMEAYVQSNGQLLVAGATFVWQMQQAAARVVV